MLQPSFEVGPIRPPSEATSLLVRVSRNCPWNRCTFCPLYKQRQRRPQAEAQRRNGESGAEGALRSECPERGRERFSLRSLEEILGDISAMAEAARRVEARAAERPGGAVDSTLLRQLVSEDPQALQVAVFLAEGAKSAFLQDADSLVLPPDELAEVLEALHGAFPRLQRVTSYARARTLVRRTVEDLRRLREAGLNRIHVGLESGADVVLEAVDKGATAEQQIEAGRRVKAAGMELSLYVMPGVGGRAHSAVHARETARVLRAIDPHFVRLRSLAVPFGSPLHEAQERGDFEALSELEVVAEIRELVAGLEGMTSTLQSDHVLNLLGDLEGTLPDDHGQLLALLDTFLGLDEERQELFVVGRRLGLLSRPMDLFDELLEQRVRGARERLLLAFGGDLESAIRELRLRFI